MMEDLEEASRGLTRWRKGPYLVALAGVFLFLAGQAADWWWEASLTKTRCTILSAKAGGEIVITPGTRAFGRRSARGKWVDHTVIEFQVEGAGTRRSIQERNDFRVGQVVNCWITAKDLYLNPTWERAISWNESLTLAAMFIWLGLIWGLWMRLSPPATAPPR